METPHTEGCEHLYLKFWPTAASIEQDPCSAMLLITSSTAHTTPPARLCCDLWPRKPWLVRERQAVCASHTAVVNRAAVGASCGTDVCGGTHMHATWQIHVCKTHRNRMFRIITYKIYTSLPALQHSSLFSYHVYRGSLFVPHL